MAVVQTTYPDSHGVGRPGQVASGATFDADSYIARGTIGFGVACRLNDVGTTGGALGTRGRIEVSAGMADNNFVGVSILDPTRDRHVPPGSSVVAADQYSAGEHVAVCYRGDVYVQVDENVRIGNDVTADPTTGSLATYPASAPAAWAATTAYVVGSLVTHNSNEYRCIRAHTASATANSVDGAPGAAGATAWESYGGTPVAIPNALWIRGADANGIAVVRLNGNILGGGT